MKKIVIVTVILSVALFGVLALGNKPIEAQTGGADPELLKKLDNVLNNQKEILRGIAELRQELYIVKIRVTQQQ